MKEIYVVAAKRTPFGKYNGFFKNESATDLGVMALKGTLNSAQIKAEDIEALLMGNVLSTGLGENMARQVALCSGMKNISASTTINEVCGSSLKAMRLAQGQMEMGDLNLVAVGGAESMTNAPYFVANQDDAQNHLQSSMLIDGLNDAFLKQHMGITTENVARKYHVSRKEMDEFSLRSHQKATRAVKNGSFKNEIIPSNLDDKKLTHDESIRPDTSMAALANLKPSFKRDGKVTAGNASPLSDGASMVILATGEKIDELNLKPLARLGAFAESGIDPAYMGYAPYYAVTKLLHQTGRKITDYDIIELNEAFASQSVALVRDLQIPVSKLNIFGGAIALGHPLAASGTRLVASAINSLEHVNGKLALVTLCIGGGQAIAYEIKRDF